MKRLSSIAFALFLWCDQIFAISGCGLTITQVGVNPLYIGIAGWYTATDMQVFDYWHPLLSVPANATVFAALPQGACFDTNAVVLFYTFQCPPGSTNYVAGSLNMPAGCGNSEWTAFYTCPGCYLYFAPKSVKSCVDSQ